MYYLFIYLSSIFLVSISIYTRLSLSYLKYFPIFWYNIRIIVILFTFFFYFVKILHFFNTPPGLTEDQLIGIFNIKEVPATSVRLFPLKTERSSSGLIEFANIALAVVAIMKCNHLPIEGKGKQFIEWKLVVSICLNLISEM